MESMQKRKRHTSAGRRARRGDSDARGRLLDAATAVFAERGIANTTVAQIAAAGGVTSAMIHYWFDTRERLLDALVEERLAPLFNYVWDTEADRDNPSALAAGIIRRMFEVTGRMPWLPSLWLREVAIDGGLLREHVLRRIPGERVAAFNEAMAQGRGEGALNPNIEPRLIFVSILALVMLPQATVKIWRRIYPHTQLERPTLERHVTALLMEGITSRRAAGGERRRQSTMRKTS
jgi:AcrR family transcriptional regulator